MRKLFADGKIKKVSKKLAKYIKKEYDPIDGNIWAEISNMSIDLDGNIITLIVRFGREQSEKSDFTRELEIVIADGKVDFIVGQIVGVIIHNEW